MSVVALVLAALAVVACGGPGPNASAKRAPPTAPALDAPAALHTWPARDLVALLTPDHPLLLRVAVLISERGDATTQELAGMRLVAMADDAASDVWRAQVRASLARPDLDPRAVDADAIVRQELRLETLYRAMVPLRAAAIATHCEGVLRDATRSRFHRAQALAVLLAQARPLPDDVAERPKEDDGPAVVANPPAAKPSDRSVAGASQVVVNLKGAFRSCYQLELNRDRTAQGHITLIAKVGATGMVDDVKAVKSTMSRELARCLAYLVEHATFSPPEGGSAVVTIPITFVKQ